MMGYDLFGFYQLLLFVALTFYSALLITSSAIGLVRLVSGSDRQKRLLRTYLAYQLLTVRWRIAADELLQIAAWTLLLVVVWVAHGWI